MQYSKKTAEIQQERVAAMKRKESIPVRPVLVGWTALFCLFLAALALGDRDAVMEPLPAALPAGEAAVVELNTAGLEELTALPGIGEALTRRILDYRAERGPFGSPEELMEVQGIGEGKYEALRGRITANGKGTT